HHSSVELRVAIIDSLDLPQRIKSWTSPESRLATLDALCQIAGEYEDAAHQTRMPVTPAGLLDHLKEAGTAYEQTSAHDAVLVTTMHQSKGLQWPVVVVGIPIDKDYGHREINVEKAPVFDARHPLANRSLRYLPGVLKNYGPLKQRLGELDVVSRAQDAEDRETTRLLYVALTRAECHSIMAFGGPVGRLNVLSASVDDELLQWEVPTATDGDSIAANEAGTIQIAARRRTGDDGGANPHTLPIRINAYSLEAEDNCEQSLEPSAPSFYAATDIHARRPAETPLHLPARFTASGVPSDGVKADVALIADLGEPLVAKGGRDWDRIGDAVHAYLGLPLSRLSHESAAEAAERILFRWDAGRALTSGTLIELGRRWTGWIASTYPDAEVVTESPIAWRNVDGQVMEGWVDARVVLPNGGHILVDHKSYPGTDPIGHIRENYFGQLEVYAQALQDTVGRVPEQILIHLPLLGAIAEVRLPVAQVTTRSEERRVGK